MCSQNSYVFRRTTLQSIIALELLIFQDELFIAAVYLLFLLFKAFSDTHRVRRLRSPLFLHLGRVESLYILLGFLAESRRDRAGRNRALSLGFLNIIWEGLTVKFIYCVIKDMSNPTECFQVILIYNNVISFGEILRIVQELE